MSNIIYPPSLAYVDIETTQEAYTPKYWAELTALYKGGRHLLRDNEVMHNVFPAHMYESSDLYEERKRRAFYVNYCGEIIDHMVSALTAHPVKVWADEGADEFYTRFTNDVSYPGGKRTSLAQLIRKQVLSALVNKTSWTLLDFPRDNGLPDDEVLKMSEAEQTRAGLLDAYALPIHPNNVLNWEEGPDGELLWVKTCFVRRNRSFHGVAALETKTYTIYGPKTWATYEISYEVTKPPRPKDEVAMVDAGEHSFGRVPFARLDLPYGLWAMNKLESLAREHLNKRCALAWAEYKTLYPTLYEFEQNGGEECLGGAGEDTGRFMNQVRGIGYVQVRAEGDRAQYVGPDSAPFKSALDSLKDLRDEMHRVTHQMALSFDNHALALRRSGNSKEQDKKDAHVVLGALGRLVREHVYDMYTIVSAGRQEDIDWNVGGLDEFDKIDVTATILQAETVAKLQIPSKTFNAEHQTETATAILGENASRDTLEAVASEIREANREDIARFLPTEQNKKSDPDTKPQATGVGKIEVARKRAKDTEGGE